MKKFLVLSVALVMGASMFSSCKKCSTCKYTYDLLGATQTYTYPEQCGKKSEIETYEDACASAATLAGGTCTCD